MLLKVDILSEFTLNYNIKSKYEDDPYHNIGCNLPLFICTTSRR